MTHDIEPEGANTENFLKLRANRILPNNLILLVLHFRITDKLQEMDGLYILMAVLAEMMMEDDASDRRCFP